MSRFPLLTASQTLTSTTRTIEPQCESVSASNTDALRLKTPAREISLALLETLPPCRFAIAYGSGVFAQHLPSSACDGERRHSALPTPMIDHIVVVDDAHQWHRANMRRNPSHYHATMHTIGARWVARLQRFGGGRLHYNTMVRFGRGRGHLVKYGVIERGDLIEDLTQWRFLYAAGRMQKPLAVLVSDAEIERAVQCTRQCALDVALLLLPSEFSARELYMTIAGLSYGADCRRWIGGEPSDKLRRLVEPHLGAFERVYAEATCQYRVMSGRFRQEASTRARFALLRRLPDSMRRAVVHERCRVLRRAGAGFDDHDEDSVLVQLALERPEAIAEFVRLAIWRVSWSVNVAQGLKCYVVAGPSKAFRYGLLKAIKTLTYYWSDRR